MDHLFQHSQKWCTKVCLVTSIILCGFIITGDKSDFGINAMKIARKYQNHYMTSDKKNERQITGSFSKIPKNREHFLRNYSEMADFTLVEKHAKNVSKHKTPRKDRNIDLKKELMLGVTVNMTGIELTVHGKTAYSCINRTMVYGNDTVSLCSGIHLITLHQTTGHVMRAESYMTWQTANDAYLVETIGRIQDGRLLVFIGVPPFNKHLEDETIETLFDLGSEHIHLLSTIEPWCFIVYKGGSTILEMTVLDPAVSLNATAVQSLELHIGLPSVKARHCQWYGQAGQEEKAKFCETYSGYGEYCSCSSIPWNPKPKKKLEFPMKEVIPVVIITARRLPGVLRQVGQIWANAGGSKTPVMIFVDGENPEAMALGRLINVPVVEDIQETPKTLNSHKSVKGSDDMAKTTKRISNHVKFSLTEVFKRYPGANKAIFIEDDLDLAPDFISYFHQTASLLDSDEKILCVNAFNQNAFSHTALDPSRLYRTTGVPSLGWMVSRRVAKEMIENWTPANKSIDWDLWLRYSMVLPSKRNIIIPEIPRTRHRGGGGSHVSGLAQQLYFNQQPINQEANIIIDTKSVTRDDYLNFHYQAIAKAKILRFEGNRHPCQDGIIPRNKVNETYVIYVYQPSETDPSSQALQITCACFGVQDRAFHETLMMMIAVPFFQNRLYIVACPNSPFCMTQDPKDIYYATPEDFTYAYNHPFRKINITTYFTKRVSPISFEEGVTLQNIENYRHSLNFL